jgi:two-component system LytT family response regulator
MRILIVDDERPARDKLRRLLEQEPGITAIEEARDGIEAIERVATFAPDAIFLDVQMPEISGLEVAASLPDPAPLLVFATAYDEYAVRAFDANAIDYLLKPFDQARLQRSLQRLRDRLSTPSSKPGGSHNVAATSFTPLVSDSASVPLAGLPPPHQLMVTERGVTRVVRVADIQWLETADNYVVLHTSNGSPLLRQTLAGLLETVGPGFMRCHRRAAVQLQWIESIEATPKGDGEVLLRGGARAPLSRQFRQNLLSALG